MQVKKSRLGVPSTCAQVKTLTSLHLSDVAGRGGRDDPHLSPPSRSIRCWASLTPKSVVEVVLRVSRDAPVSKREKCA